MLTDQQWETRLAARLVFVKPRAQAKYIAKARANREADKRRAAEAAERMAVRAAEEAAYAKTVSEARAKEEARIRELRKEAVKIATDHPEQALAIWCFIHTKMGDWTAERYQRVFDCNANCQYKRVQRGREYLEASASPALKQWLLEHPNRRGR